MSRIISEKAANALENNQDFKLSNTEVKNNALYLFKNKIAWIENNHLFICLCGWNSNTTKERLNALNGVNIKQIKGKLFLNGEEINEYDTYKIC